MEEINMLIKENKELKKRMKNVERLTVHLMDNHLMDNSPQTEMISVFSTLSYGYNIVKSNMTLIVFLNGLTLFGYGLAEMFL